MTKIKYDKETYDSEVAPTESGYYFTIYQITNLINGKIYVGKNKTKKLLNNYLGSGKLLHFAYKKYGLENFEKKYLYFLTSANEMNNKEAEIVNEEFILRKDTYNIALGGYMGVSHEIAVSGVNALWKKINSDTELRKQYIQKLKEAGINFAKNNPENYKRRAKKQHRYWKNNKEKHPQFGKRKEKCMHFGQIHICNDLTKENLWINKNDQIPPGFRRGMIKKYKKDKKLS